MSFNHLEDLPNDILSEIFVRVGAESRADLGSCLLASTELHAPANDPKVFKYLCLSDLVNNPRLGLGPLSNVMHKCLVHSNPTAEYVKGILAFFVADNVEVGLKYLKKASDASVQEAVYIYGIVKLCMGDFEEGKRYLELLKWRTNTDIAEECWNNIRVTLRGIRFARKPLYFQSLRGLKPRPPCNPYDFDLTCEECYYFKMVLKFIFMF